MKEKEMISEEEFSSMKSKILLSMIENKDPKLNESEQISKVEKRTKIFLRIHNHIKREIRFTFQRK